MLLKTTGKLVVTGEVKVDDVDFPGRRVAFPRRALQKATREEKRAEKKAAKEKKKAEKGTAKAKEQAEEAIDSVSDADG